MLKVDLIGQREFLDRIANAGKELQAKIGHEVQAAGLQNFYFNTILKDDEVTYVKCSARIENVNSFDGNTTLLTNFNSGSHTMFKVFINGVETTDYTTSGNQITFNSRYNYFNNNITVVYYLNNQTFTGSATLLFYGVNKSIPSALDYMNGYSMSGSVTRDSTNTFRINGANTSGCIVTGKQIGRAHV